MMKREEAMRRNMTKVHLTVAGRRGGRARGNGELRNEETAATITKWNATIIIVIATIIIVIIIIIVTVISRRERLGHRGD